MIEEVKQNDDDEKDNNIDHNKVWRSCCFQLNSHCVSYFGQLIFSMSMLAFCGIMLFKADGNCEKSSSYINILSFMLGKILSSIQSSSTEK